MLFFASFDAIVLLASVYILFPQEHAEYTDRTIEHFQWTIERFSAIQERNPLAKSAQGVLKAIVARFKRAMVKARNGSLPSLTEGFTTGSSKAVSSSTPSSSTLESSDFSGLATTDPTWMLPSTDELNMMAPFFPTGDLVYNDLTAGPDMTALPLPSADDQGAGEMWQFGGGWGDDTVWQVLNQFPAAMEDSGLNLV